MVLPNVRADVDFGRLCAQQNFLQTAIAARAFGVWSISKPASGAHASFLRQRDHRVATIVSRPGAHCATC